MFFIPSLLKIDRLSEETFRTTRCTSLSRPERHPPISFVHVSIYNVKQQRHHSMADPKADNARRTKPRRSTVPLTGGRVLNPADPPVNFLFDAFETSIRILPDPTNIPQPPKQTEARLTNPHHTPRCEPAVGERGSKPAKHPCQHPSFVPSNPVSGSRGKRRRIRKSRQFKGLVKTNQDQDPDPTKPPVRREAGF